MNYLSRNWRRFFISLTVSAFILIGYSLTTDKGEIITYLILGNKDRVYNHIGIPTDVKHEDEVYIEAASVYVTKNEADSYGIEWVRHEPDCPFPDLVKKTAHVAFIVKDLSKDIEGENVIFGPVNHPTKDVSVAFIEENGAPIELIQIGRLYD